MTAAKGFVSGEVLRSFGEGGDRLLLVTRWKDTDSLSDLAEMAGAPDDAGGTAEEPLLAGSPFVDHWRRHNRRRLELDAPHDAPTRRPHETPPLDALR